MNKVKKAKNIKILLTDVDCVLTDGGMYYTTKGDQMKKFHTRDGMGINILLRNGIKTCIITKENSKITKKWAKEMNVTKTFSGVIKKELELSKICQKFNVKTEEVAYIGDDVNDLELMKKVGLGASPKDGIEQIKKEADYVCKLNGGEGSFREFSDLILSIKFPKKKRWY